MNIGIDFYDTITADPSRFRRLIRSLKDRGHSVFIVSAVRKENIGRLQKDFKRSRVRCELAPVVFDNYFDVPKLKLRECRRLGIDEMIDDRADTCKLLEGNGIRGTKYLNWKNIDYNNILERY